MPRLQLIGYWRADGDAASEYPHPSDWVDHAWDRDTRRVVGAYFASGTVVCWSAGVSPCRLCGRANGAAEYTDGVYIWPEGLAHYVDEHAVRLPEAVIAHAISRVDLLEDAEISEDWWTDQPKTRGNSVTSVSSATAELPGPPVSRPATSVECSSDGEAPHYEYLDPTNVWRVMAQLLVAENGHRILSSTARATLSGDRAEVSWTEIHRMTGGDYRSLVERAHGFADDQARR